MQRLKEQLALITATCFYLGCVPVAPGTAGALLGVAIYVPIAWLVAGVWAQTAWVAVALLISSALTVALAPWAERHWGKKDAGSFVTDEVAGYLLTVLLFPAGPAPLAILWTFVATRVFDISKPPPCRQLEYLPSGWGVLADDLMASVYAAAFLHALYYCCPVLFG